LSTAAGSATLGSATAGSATALCGVILHPALHTRSPAMHRAAYAFLGLDAVYVAFDVPPARLPEAILGVRALGLRQLSVSIPHKQAVMPFLDAVDGTAARIGAVNTVVRQGERLVGHNTDWLGAVQALERERELAGSHAVVLGAGGAARGVIFGLLQRGADVTVLNRTPVRARELARELGASASGSLDELGAFPFDVLVNTTSVGLRSDASPVAAEAIPKSALVMDAVYEPEQTRLLRDAQARGARTLSGKWMLVLQAAEQLRLWSGREAPVDVMADAFDRAGSATTR
jgi:shikimate dehydrogenase